MSIVVCAKVVTAGQKIRHFDFVKMRQLIFAEI